MSRRALTLPLLSALLIATGSTPAAESTGLSQEEVHYKIRMMERSVTDSYVTDRYSDI